MNVHLDRYAVLRKPSISLSISDCRHIYKKSLRMAAKVHMLVVAALACSALAANAKPAAIDKDVAAAFEEAMTRPIFRKSWENIGKPIGIIIAIL